jgi:hypothetical protein
VQLGFHQTPILKCTIMAQNKYSKVKILFKEDARCLPCSGEEALSKLGMLSNPIGLVAMQYDAGNYVRYKRENGKSDTAQKP